MDSLSKRQEKNVKARKLHHEKIQKKVERLLRKGQRKITQDDILNLQWEADPKRGILDPHTQMPIFVKMLRLRKEKKLTKKLFNKHAFDILVQEPAVSESMMKWVWGP